jgi:phosphoribosylformylglycinamidine synthase
VAPLLHDRMTESVIDPAADPALLFRELESKPMQTVPMLALGREALERANVEMGLALSSDEIEYLLDAFMRMRRDPTDVELMMFAQANSEHCRHKIFNATWTIDGERQGTTLFDMIRATHRAAPQGTVIAYSDNAAVLEGRTVSRFYPHSDHAAGASGIDYGAREELTHTVFKVETHNHPTAISPFPVRRPEPAAIRDEGATTGAKPKAGLCGFSVSHLRIPDMRHAWEDDFGFHRASPTRCRS